MQPAPEPDPKSPFLKMQISGEMDGGLPVRLTIPVTWKVVLLVGGALLWATRVTFQLQALTENTAALRAVLAPGAGKLAREP